MSKNALDRIVLPGLARNPLDSVDKTDVKAPNPMLLAIAKGKLPARPSRRTWFVLGMLAGASLMWLAIGNVRPVFEMARGWSAQAIESFTH